VLDGAKQFITSGKNGNVIIVFAVTDPDAGKKGITAFIVPTDTPGYEVIRVEDKLGLHSSDTCQIAFNEMRIPAELRLGAKAMATASRLPISKAAASASRAGGRHGAGGVRGGARLCPRAHRLRQADHRASGRRLSPCRYGDTDRGGAAARAFMRPT
jgi:alkylation response protein AidB-like acyl-CoA dehydrogenase